ncbi:MAG: hypothetical protein ACLGJB_24830 [Blastocatellia bacterium]
MWQKIIQIRCKECDWNGEEAVLVEDQKQEVNLPEARCQYDPSHYIEWRVARVEEFDALREYTKKTYGYDPGPTPVQEKELSEEEGRRQAESELKELLRVRFFASNPNATPDDFERLYPQLRDAHMLDSANTRIGLDSIVDVYERHMYGSRD